MSKDEPARSALWKRLWICQVWAFALFLPINAELTTDHNRYLMHWATWKLGVFFLANAVLGLLLFALGTLVERIKPEAYRPTAALAAVVSLAFLAWSLMYHWWPIIFTFVTFSPLALLLAIGVCFSLWRRGIGLEHVRHGLCHAAIFMGFLVPMFWLNGLRYPSFPRIEYPGVHEVADRPMPDRLLPADNVFVFLCDEWSYRWTFENGKVRESLPNIRAFAETACVFHEAHSPSCHTLIALPRILFQRNDLYKLHAGQLGFDTAEGFRPCRELPNIFDQARERGFRTYMVGWYHPYYALLAESVDHLHVRSYWDRIGPSPVDTFRGIYWRWGRKFAGPVWSHFIGCGEGQMKNYAHLRQAEDLIAATRRVLSDDRPRGQFAFFHLPLPHAPFIYKPDGSLRDLDVKHPRNDVGLYYEQLQYVDKLLGEFLDELKRQGRYDNSIVVLMSDHTFRADGGEERKAAIVSHVPLFVRFPRQREQVILRTPFTTSWLMSFIDQVATAAEGPQAAGEILERYPWFLPLDEEERFLERLPSD